MWLDLVGLAILAVFMIMGLLRGSLPSLLRIMSLVAAYAAAVLTAPALGPAVAERMSLPVFLGIPIAGSVAFLGVYTVLGVLSRLVQGWENRRRDGEPRSSLDRTGGALLGGLQGAFVMLLIGWLGLWVEAGRAAGSLEGLPDPGGSALIHASQAVVEAGASALVDDSEPGARMAVNMAARPKETIEGLQRLLGNPRILALQEDRVFWSYVESGAIDVALNQGSFLGIAYDDTLRKELADVGLIKDYAAADPRLFRAEVKDALEQVSPRIRGLKNDPAVKQLMNDPNIVIALEQRDHLTLIQNPAFRELIGRVMEGTPQQN